MSFDLGLKELVELVKRGDQNEVILFFVFHASQVDDYVRALDAQSFKGLLEMVESTDSKIPYLVSVAVHERAIKEGD